MTVHANPITLHMAFERLQFETGFDVHALIAERDGLRELLDGLIGGIAAEGYPVYVESLRKQMEALAA